MIEIEKKFLLSDEQQERLLAGAVADGRKQVEDSYFDTEGYGLTKKNYWLRLRDGEYELKAPLPSSSSIETTNQYYEITDLEEIAQKIDLVYEGGDFETSLARAGIVRFMSCKTDRRTYRKNEFRIDIDEVTYPGSDFEYAVAEIELIVASEAEVDEAERRIVAFAESFGLPVDEVVLGKVASYLKSERPEHYAVLVAAGVLK